jgi:uncharacterized membrane protein
MNSGRLEAFSDGVIAILITIMVLELKIPQGADWAALRPFVPALLTYALSFVYLGIYWNNHHHTFQATESVNGKVLWANLNLLFWLSLVPFATAWVGQNHSAPLPTAIYGALFFLAAVAYTILLKTLIKHQGPDSKLAAAIGEDMKGKLSLVLYLLAIPLAFVNTLISDALYVAVALIWFIPDRRIEKELGIESAVTEVSERAGQPRRFSNE